MLNITVISTITTLSAFRSYDFTFFLYLRTTFSFQCPNKHEFVTMLDLSTNVLKANHRLYACDFLVFYEFCIFACIKILVLRAGFLRYFNVDCYF